MQPILAMLLPPGIRNDGNIICFIPLIRSCSVRFLKILEFLMQITSVTYDFHIKVIV